MPKRNFAHLFRQISERAFHLHRKDLDSLRNMFMHKRVDVSRIAIARMKRPQLVNAIVAAEFGAEALMDYISQCSEWDETEKLLLGVQ